MRLWRRNIPRSRATTGAPSGTPTAVGAATPERINEHFWAAVREFRAKQYEQAAASFSAVEAECPRDFFYFVLAKTRRACCFLARARWAEALAIFDELAADTEALAAFDRAMLNPELRESSFKDDVPTIYWSRCVCLENLGRLPEACARGAELIERVGTGTTPQQRSYVAGLYLLQAKYAMIRKQFTKAAIALDATIAQCAAADTPDAKRALHDAEQMRQDLQARVRINRPPRGA